MSQVIHRRLQEMAEEEGPEFVSALRRLAVCRGGFTIEAAAAILDLEGNEAEAVHVLATLRAWQFVTMQTVADGQRGRYAIDPLVIEAVGKDEEAVRAHFDYYEALAQQHCTTGDYAGLDAELANLQTALNGALADDIAAAYLLYSACSDFLMQGNYHDQHLAWIQQIAEAAAGHPDESLWGAIQNSLGVAYQNLPSGDRRENLWRAIVAYQECLQYHTPATTQQAHALTQHNLGSAYADLARIENRVDNLWQAVEAYEEALKFRTADDAPRAYAATQHNLGNAYRDLAGVGDRADNLQHAIRAYCAALDYYTPQDAPLDYAATQNNLGNAYRDLAGVENRVENLQQAVEAYEEALLYRTPQSAPLSYAATQNNLGTAFRALANEENHAANLRRAVTAFKEAQRYYSAQSAPLDYAAIQSNLGSAYRALAEIENQSNNLNQAIAAFEDALQYCTPQVAPLDYATTQANLGLTWADLGDSAMAVHCWREAAQYFQQMGASDKVELVLEWITQIEDTD